MSARVRWWTRTRYLLQRIFTRPPPVVDPTEGFAIHTDGATLTFVTTRGSRIGNSVKVAATFRSRSVGLLNYGPLLPDEGLLLSPGGSIHTFGMYQRIDVLFLDWKMCVLKCVPCLRPWRLAFAPRGTCYVLELAEGRIAATRVQVGTWLFWSETRKAEVLEDFVERRSARMKAR